MNALTLKYDGVEKTLDAWGFFSQPNLVYRSRAAGSLTLTVAIGDPAAAPAIPYGGQVILKDAGTVIFVGKRRDCNGNAGPDSRNVTMVFKDAWDSLERTPYQMEWNTSGGVVLSARLFLFQNLGNSTTPWSYWQSKDQIIDAINYAHAECGIAIQAGTIDPVMPQAIYACRSLSCAEVINIALSSLPDAMTWFDYTTVDGGGNPLPKLYVRQRQNATPITLPYDDGAGGIHKSTGIKSREDLQVSQVVFQYQETNNVSGTEYLTYGTDAYPLGSTGNVENAQVLAIDLRGASRNIATCQVVAAAVDPTTPAFWSDKDKSLATVGSLALVNAAVNDGSAFCITAVDHTGANISLATYPNEFKNGGCAPWAKDNTNTPIKVIEAIITAHLKYTKNHPVATGLKTDDVTDHVISTRVRLTNSAVGTQTYKAQASGASAELPPDNLAYAYWCSVNNVPINYVGGVITPPSTAPSISGASNLQWEGEHSIVQQSITNYYNCGNLLNLSGGASNWAEMDAAIYEVEYDFFHGVSIIRFGPHKNLTPDQFFKDAMIYRTRVAWDDPNVRNTGYDTTGAGTASIKDTRVSDTTTASPPAKQSDSVAAPPAGGTSAGAQTGSTRDMATNGGQWSLGTFISGALQTSASATPADSVLLTLDDLADAANITDFADIRFRTITYKVTDPDTGDCVDKYRVVVCSQEFDGTGP